MRGTSGIRPEEACRTFVTCFVFYCYCSSLLSTDVVGLLSEHAHWEVLAVLGEVWVISFVRCARRLSVTGAGWISRTKTVLPFETSGNDYPCSKFWNVTTLRVKQLLAHAPRRPRRTTTSTTQRRWPRNVHNVGCEDTCLVRYGAVRVWVSSGGIIIWGVFTMSKRREFLIERYRVWRPSRDEDVRHVWPRWGTCKVL